jgi:hypothetical protein
LDVVRLSADAEAKLSTNEGREMLAKHGMIFDEEDLAGFGAGLVWHGRRSGRG